MKISDNPHFFHQESGVHGLGYTVGKQAVKKYFINNLTQFLPFACRAPVVQRDQQCGCKLAQGKKARAESLGYFSKLGTNEYRFCVAALHEYLPG